MKETASKQCVLWISIEDGRLFSWLNWCKENRIKIAYAISFALEFHARTGNYFCIGHVPSSYNPADSPKKSFTRKISWDNLGKSTKEYFDSFQETAALKRSTAIKMTLQSSLEYTDSNSFDVISIEQLCAFITRLKNTGIAPDAMMDAKLFRAEETTSHPDATVITETKPAATIRYSKAEELTKEKQTTKDENLNVIQNLYENLGIRF